MSDTPVAPPPAETVPTPVAIRILAWGLVGLAVLLLVGGLVRAQVDLFLGGSGEDSGWTFLGLVLVALLVPLSLGGFLLRYKGVAADSAVRQFLIQLGVLVPFALMCALLGACFLGGALAVALLLELLWSLGMPVGGEGLGAIGMMEGGAFLGGVVGASIGLWWLLRRARK